MLKKSLHYGLTIIIMGVVIYFFTQKEMQESLTLIRHFSPSVLGVLLILQLLTHALCFYQWKLLFSCTNVAASSKTLLRMQSVGVFYESITPALKAGGEAFKVLYLKSKGYDAYQTSAIMVMQKSLSMLMFIPLCVISLLYALYIGVNPNTLLPALLSVLLLLAILLLLGFWILRSKKSIRFLGVLKNSIMQATMCKEGKKAFILSLCIWLLFPLKCHLLLIAFGVEVPYFFILPLTFIPYLVATLPLSIAGLGTYEATFIYLLSPYALLKLSVSVSVMMRFVTYWFMFLIASIHLIILKKGEHHDFNPATTR